MGERLEGWKTKYLSMAGRHVLAQSVLTSIPLYSMQSALLSITFCNRVDKLVRQFLWGSSNEKKKMHLVNWEYLVTSEKEHGGLGIKQTHNMNLVFMAKLGWRLIAEEENLWAQVILSKYVKGRAEFSKLVKKKGTSNAWKEIASTANILLKGARTRVYNGVGTLFWRDTWLGETL